MYANRKNLAALFGVTTQTVYRRVKGIEALIGERYNRYAVLDNLVSVAVYVVEFWALPDSTQCRTFQPVM